MHSTQAIPTRADAGLAGTTNARNNQAPFSLAEFAAASVAMAVVAVVSFRGILESQESNVSAASLSRLRTTIQAQRSLQVGQWRLDNADLNARAQPIRTPEIVTVRRGADAFPPGWEIASQAIQNPGASDEPRASTFFVEASPATIVEIRLFDAALLPPTLTGPSDLFRMKNAISPNALNSNAFRARPVKPVQEVTLPPDPGRRDNR